MFFFQKSKFRIHFRFFRLVKKVIFTKSAPDLHWISYWNGKAKIAKWQIFWKWNEQSTAEFGRSRANRVKKTFQTSRLKTFARRNSMWCPQTCSQRHGLELKLAKLAKIIKSALPWYCAGRWGPKSLSDRFFENPMGKVRRNSVARGQTDIQNTFIRVV